MSQINVHDPKYLTLSKYRESHYIWSEHNDSKINSKKTEQNPYNWLQ